jgi:phosphatidylserine/phosphatidylglycerophosphate/cardiolipin synthase-like enzyme
LPERPKSRRSSELESGSARIEASTASSIRARTPSEHEARFVQRFLATQWRGARLPEVFHDPRTIEDARISLHAKCIVVDDEVSLVTSANTSVAAQEENIEAGVLVEDRLFALALAKQFDDLVTARLLVPVQGLSKAP